ncbi:uncharacterized protein OCT59_023355 [Rhizophagus irregularis]|uniref:uncharacterized protein n=1 Tax=Rhizophagus irregularis TaxID=588596 RepID=UPI001C1585B8|nr:hypothetical protein OCT59_023355 [Rhizophagus irregularis]CAB5213862.1 unnamed protein product [Rhizophagus irregularis]
MYWRNATMLKFITTVQALAVRTSFVSLIHKRRHSFMSVQALAVAVDPLILLKFLMTVQALAALANKFGRLATENIPIRLVFKKFDA